MKLNIRRTAGLVAAAALLGTIPGTITTAQARTVRPATASHAIGKLRVTLVGVPHTIKRGTTFTIRIWYIENSPDAMTPTGFTVAMSPVHRGAGNVWVNWLNPVAKRWQPSTQVLTDSGVHILTVPINLLVIPSNHWAHVDARIYVGKHARLGAWTIAAPLYGVALLKPNGNGDTNYLDQSGARVYPVNVVR